MAEGPNAQSARRPTMIRAALSALALLVLTALLARAVCSQPSQSDDDGKAEAGVTQVRDTRDTRDTLKAYPIKEHVRDTLEAYPTREQVRDALEAYPIKEHVRDTLEAYPTREQVRDTLEAYPTRERGRRAGTFARPVAQRRPVVPQSSPSRPKILSADGHELIVHKVDLDATNRKPFVTRGGAPRKRDSDPYSDTLLIPDATVARPKNSARTTAKVPGKSQPDTSKKVPLLMESPDWYRPKKLTKAMEARRDRIRQCLDFYYDRPLRSAEDSSWSMMHHMLAWGIDSRILVNDRDGKTRNVSTIAWLCGNGICRDERLLSLKDGRIHPRVGPGLQGHDAQFLALLAQSRVSVQQTILVEGQEFSIADLIREEQLSCRPRSELTFKLISFAHYLPLDSKWKNDKGDEWSIERLIEEELRQPINGVTCGGTHRLMGFTYAAARRRQEGAPMTGLWAQAEIMARRHQQLAFRLQNPDGSFSSDFFRNKGTWGDIDRKLKTTGHVLEWLLFSLPHDELDSPQVLRATDYLCNLLAANRYYDWENGPLGHGIRALAIYDERAFGGRPGHRDLKMAEKLPQIRPKPARPPASSPPKTSPRYNNGPRGFLGIRKM